MIETIIYNRLNLTIQECKGTITNKDLLDTAQSFFGNPHTFNVIWDFSFAHLTDISPQTINELVSIWLEQSACSGCCKTAIVAPANLEYGFSNMFKAISDMVETTLEAKVFESLGEAKHWLLSEG